jgi:hypothetical protein
MMDSIVMHTGANGTLISSGHKDGKTRVVLVIRLAGNDFSVSAEVPREELKALSDGGESAKSFCDRYVAPLLSVVANQECA